jgi:hypothetical protein
VRVLVVVAVQIAGENVTENTKLPRHASNWENWEILCALTKAARRVLPLTYETFLDFLTFPFYGQDSFRNIAVPRTARSGFIPGY